jgi:hypothetical protein
MAQVRGLRVGIAAAMIVSAAPVLAGGFEEDVPSRTEQQDKSKIYKGPAVTRLKCRSAALLRNYNACAETREWLGQSRTLQLQTGLSLATRRK